MFNFFKTNQETAKMYVQEPNPEKSRQLLYVSISKDTIISNAKEQGIAVTESELDLVRAELFDKVMSDVETSIQNNLLAKYTEVAEEVINALGNVKVNGYTKVLMGVEIALPLNKSHTDSVLIKKHENTYNMIFSGINLSIPLTKLSLEQVASVFTAITGIAKATEQLENDLFASDSPKAA